MHLQRDVETGAEPSTLKLFKATHKRKGIWSRHLAEKIYMSNCDRAGVPDLSVSRDKFDLAKDDPHDPTTTSEPEAPMQSLNQLPVVTDLVDARSA